MYCTSCGVETDPQANFCSRCGHQTGMGYASGVPAQKLTRYLPKKMIAGVCAGFAKYLNVDVTIVRLVWIALFFFPLPGALIAYIIAWIILPVETEAPRVAYPMPAAG